MKIRTVLVGLIILGALGYGAYSMLHRKPAEAPKAPPAAVSAITLETKPVAIEEEFPGRATAYKVSEIRPQVSGIILNRLFTEGSLVKKGQQLYQIDPAPYQAAYDSAKADLAKAEALVKSTKAKSGRYKTLIKIEAISKQDYDDIVASLDQASADVGIAQAKLSTAKINLDYTRVYAPISGRIGKSTFTEGALVSASQADPLAVITQLDPIYVDVTQASEDVQRLRRLFKAQKKQPVTLKFQQGTDVYAHQGTLQFSDVTVDPTTGSVQLRALFPNPEGDLLPGMFVRAVMQFTAEDGILVPQRATSRTANGSLNVWVVDAENKAHSTPITTERSVGDAWLVTSGVKNGDVIVTEGMQRLKPDATVNITPDAPKEAPAKTDAPTTPEQTKPEGK